MDSAFNSYAGYLRINVSVHHVSRDASVRKRNLTRDERDAMILVSWIETFIFIRVVIIQMTQYNDVRYF